MTTLSILFNDVYQLNMVYSHWKNNTHTSRVVFEAHFRKNPFQKEFTVFAGLDRFLKYLSNFKVTESDVKSVKKIMPPTIDEGFYSYLSELSLKDVDIYAIKEGTIVFPLLPLVQICGPICMVQLLETVLLNLTNFASLVATNAAHFRIASGEKTILAEFGCRRAQGPDGALSSSLYSYIGGFNSTSNVEAAVRFGIPAVGTISHAYVSFYSPFLPELPSLAPDSLGHQLLKISKKKLQELKDREIFNTTSAYQAELLSFVCYAASFLDNFVAILDTYNVLSSGLVNFCAVALALHEVGHKAVGVRIDSGDLAYLSNSCRAKFSAVARSYDIPWFASLKIVASNELAIETIYSLVAQNHSIDVFGIGTNLVTCSQQPSLGMVYKLVESNGAPAIKLTENVQKTSIPFKKACYRLLDSSGKPILDYLALFDESPPQPGQKIICYHSNYVDIKVYVCPSEVKVLTELVFSKGKLVDPLDEISEVRQRVKEGLNSLRQDHLRYVNPTPYKVSLSENLHKTFSSCKNHFPLLELP